MWVKFSNFAAGTFNMTKEDEIYCLRALSEGSRQAFEWLFLEWHPRLVEFLMRLLGPGCEETAYDYADGEILLGLSVPDGAFQGI